VLRVEKRFKSGEGSGKGAQGSHALHIPTDGLMWFQGLPTRTRTRTRTRTHAHTHIDDSPLCHRRTAGTPVHVENHELKEYAFVHNVMRPLIGSSYVHPGVQRSHHNNTRVLRERAPS
jgi:hypothetical protein